MDDEKTQEKNWADARKLALKNHEAEQKAQKEVQAEEDKNVKTELKARPSVSESKNPTQVKTTENS